MAMLQQTLALIVLAAVSLASARVTSSTSSTPNFCSSYDCPPYTALSQGTNYEERSYARSNWVSTSPSRTSFMNLFNYISGANQRNEQIEMTVPVLQKTVPGSRSLTEMSFYISNSVGEPPAPTDDVNYLQTLENGFTVYSRSFYTFIWTSPQRCENEYNALVTELREAGKTFQTDHYYIAGYSGPWVIWKYNEIWVPKV